MILVYPSAYLGVPVPYYLVTGDKAFYIADNQTSWNMQRVGIPAIPFPQSDLDWVLEKLDPQVEHPLTAFDPDPLPALVIDGGDPTTITFITLVDGGSPGEIAFADQFIDGGSV